MSRSTELLEELERLERRTESPSEHELLSLLVKLADVVNDLVTLEEGRIENEGVDHV